MTTREFSAYFLPAAYELFGRGHPDHNAHYVCTKLGRVLGTNEFENWLNYTAKAHDKPFTDQELRLFEMILGPHSKTIIRIIRIQKGLVHET